MADAPGTLRYWVDCLDPLRELPEDTRTLLAARVRAKWMAASGRRGGLASRGRTRTRKPAEATTSG